MNGEQPLWCSSRWRQGIVLPIVVIVIAVIFFMTNDITNRSNATPNRVVPNACDHALIVQNAVRTRHRRVTTRRNDRANKVESMIHRVLIDGAAQMGAKPCAGLRELRQEKRFKIHQKKRRLQRIEDRLTKQETQQASGKVKLAFGSKALQKKQHHLKENGYASHEEWLQDWRFARSNQSFWLGDSGENYRNRNAHLDLNQKTLRLTVPERLREEFGSHVHIRGLDFRDSFVDALKEALAYEEEVLGKNGKFTVKRCPLSFRLLARRKGERVQHYLQVSFTPPKVPITTSPERGAIGLDVNTDHLALGELDRFGNPVAGYSVPLSMGQSTNQFKAQLGDHVRDIVRYAKEQGKPIVIERLDFSQKKAALRELHGPRTAEMLSRFAYDKIRAMLKSRCRKEGVELIRVNPAFSSLLGAINYFRLRHLFTSHEMAAFILGRRGMGKRDVDGYRCIQRNHQALLETVGIRPERAPVSRCSYIRDTGKRHLWSYLRRYYRALSLFMAKLKEESARLYRGSLERWSSKVLAQSQSLGALAAPL